jgi:hypothetical protein
MQRRQKIIFGEMRASGVRDVLIYCRNFSSFALLEHRFEFFFERSRRNVEHAKPRQVV